MSLRCGDIAFIYCCILLWLIPKTGWRVLRCHWFIDFFQSFYEVEWPVRLSYWKGNMDWVYLTWTCISPLSGIHPSLILPRSMYSVWEVFFHWEQFHSLQQKNTWTSSQWPEWTAVSFFVVFLGMWFYCPPSTFHSLQLLLISPAKWCLWPITANTWNSICFLIILFPSTG